MISRRVFCGSVPAISLSLATCSGLAQTAKPSALPSHGRYDYSSIKSRKPYRWPNGTSLAVYAALNLEHFAFGEGLGAELAPGGPQPDILNFAWRDYGNRVGVWRLFDLFDEIKWPASILVNTSIYAYCPDVMAAARGQIRESTVSGPTSSAHMHASPPMMRDACSGASLAASPPSGSTP